MLLFALSDVILPPFILNPTSMLQIDHNFCHALILFPSCAFATYSPHSYTIVYIKKVLYLCADVHAIQSNLFKLSLLNSTSTPHTSFPFPRSSSFHHSSTVFDEIPILFNILFHTVSYRLTA